MASSMCSTTFLHPSSIKAMRLRTKLRLLCTSGWNVGCNQITIPAVRLILGRRPLKRSLILTPLMWMNSIGTAKVPGSVNVILDTILHLLSVQWMSENLTLEATTSRQLRVQTSVSSP